jgi:uncharacterized integral membrane protein (TIGR00698 family)
MSDGPPAANPYEDPKIFRFAGSMEGVPDPAAARTDEAWRGQVQAALDATARVLPGVAIAGLLAFVAVAVTRWVGVEALGFARTPVPPALAAIVLGLAIRNGLGLPASYDEGLRFCVQRVLRVGVALLGLRLSLAAVGSIGLAALPIILACIATALVLVTLVNRVLRLPGRLGTLIAVGTAICGNSAIAATGPAIGAKEDEVSYAVGCVTLFGLLALLFYPFLSQALFAGNPQVAGIFLGAAIHDTAQVAGAGMLAAQQIGSPEVLETAAVTKLLRNAFMIVVVPGAAWLHLRGAPTDLAVRLPRWQQVVPLFVIGFLALAILRTLGDLGGESAFGLLGAEQWRGVIAGALSVSSWCLGLAMAAIGLGTNLRNLHGLGLRPLAVGFAAATTVGIVAAGLLQLLAR